MFTMYASEDAMKLPIFSRDLNDSQRLERMMQFGAIAVSQIIGLFISQKVIEWKEERDRRKQGAGLPQGKTYHVFLSHKKEKPESETLAVSLKDILASKGYSSFFDKDNLDQISQEVLDQSIRESCCLLVVLDDVTLNSEWCRAEIKTAHAAGIYIRCLVDSDRYITGDLTKQWFASEHRDVAALIFANQILEWKTAFRHVAIDRLTGILDNILNSMWDEELISLSAQEGTVVESLPPAKHPPGAWPSSSLTMEEQTNKHLSQTPGLLEAVQQKENVFWFTLATTIMSLLQSVTYLSD